MENTMLWILLIFWVCNNDDDIVLFRLLSCCDNCHLKCRAKLETQPIMRTVDSCLQKGRLSTQLVRVSFRPSVCAS